MITYHDNYLYGVNVEGINNARLAESCLQINKILPDALGFKDEEFLEDTTWHGSVSSKLNDHYNLFTFAHKEINQLYYELIKNISPVLNPNISYVLKGWMNVYEAGKNIKWHGHWPIEYEAWHGFYCVQVGESATLYQIPGREDVIKIKSKEGLLVVGKSAGDEHRSTVWNDTSMPRITIAFDVIPLKSLQTGHEFRANYFIPFKPNQNII
jgi:hypothetical protein